MIWFISYFLFVVVTLAWALYCNRMTLIERKKLIQRAYELRLEARRNNLDPSAINWPSEEATYENHLFRRMTFRDTRTLYSIGGVY